MPPKSTPTANVLGGGSLAPQFASRCGKELVDDMSSPDRGTWGDGVLVVTPSYDLDKGNGAPSHVIHFVLPSGYNGDHTYQVPILHTQTFLRQISFKMNPSDYSLYRPEMSLYMGLIII